MKTFQSAIFILVFIGASPLAFADITSEFSLATSCLAMSTAMNAQLEEKLKILKQKGENNAILSELYDITIEMRDLSERRATELGAKLGLTYSEVAQRAIPEVMGNLQLDGSSLWKKTKMFCEDPFLSPQTKSRMAQRK